MNLAILGARVVVDTGTKTVAAAVDGKKAAKWSATLESILESKLCSPDQAADSAGRLGFACAVASGKIERAFVKPFYAQANSFSRSLLLSNCLWKKALEKQFGLGLMLVEMAVVFSQGDWYYTALVVSDSVTSRLVHRDDAQINFLEMLAVVLMVETFGDLLSGNAVFA